MLLRPSVPHAAREPAIQEIARHVAALVRKTIIDLRIWLDGLAERVRGTNPWREILAITTSAPGDIASGS